MTTEELKNRTKAFAYRVIRLYRTLPKTTEAEVLGKQVLRSATSVAANYRATTRARSRAEFIAKLGVVVEEIDETLFWLECISDNVIVHPTLMAQLIKGSNELVAIFVAARKSSRSASESKS